MTLDNFRKINITLNKANQHILEPQIAKVGDVNGRELVVQLIDGGVIKDQSGVVLKLNWQHANGNQGSETFKALDAKQGLFSVYYPEKMLYRGTVKANISVNDGGNITNSLNFQIAVKGDVFDGSAVEVDGLLFTLKNLKDQIDERNGNLVDLENRQTSVESQFNSLQQEMTGKDIVSAPEIIAARNGEETLKARLDKEQQEITAQLAQTEKKIPLIANATGKLSILSPYNHYENIHPKVLHFSNGWNGFKYWMAYTPYKRGDIKEENPCIAVSNDGVDWITPSGLTNPVDDWSGLVTQYNNDTHLVFRGDLNRLELWYRTADEGNYRAYLKRKTSTNGIEWSETEFLYTGAVELDDHISPAVIYENEKYKMLSVYRKSGIWTVNYRESTDAKNWSVRQDISVPSLGSVQLWHLDFIKTDIGYEMVVTGFDTAKGETTNSANLYYLTSQDLKNWSEPEMILRPTDLEGTFDGQGIYRSTLVKIKDKYRLYYSAVGLDAERGIGLSIGDTPLTLQGQSVVSRFGSLEIGAKNSVYLEDDRNTINKVNVKQGIYPTAFGHLGIANLFFEDRFSNTTTPKNGVLAYAGTQNIFQRHSEGSWRGINTILLTKLTTTINLTSGRNTTIPFNAPVSQSAKYYGGVYTPNGVETLKVSVGSMLADAPSGEVELTIANASTDDTIGYLYRKSIATTNGNEYIDGQFVLETSIPFKIMIKYTGPATPRITPLKTQNYLLIENV